MHEIRQHRGGQTQHRSSSARMFSSLTVFLLLPLVVLSILILTTTTGTRRDAPSSPLPPLQWALGASSQWCDSAAAALSLLQAPGLSRAIVVGADAVPIAVDRSTVPAYAELAIGLRPSIFAIAAFTTVNGALDDGFEYLQLTVSVTVDGAGSATAGIDLGGTHHVPAQDTTRGLAFNFSSVAARVITTGATTSVYQFTMRTDDALRLNPPSVVGPGVRGFVQNNMVLGPMRIAFLANTSNTTTPAVIDVSTVGGNLTIVSPYAALVAAVPLTQTAAACAATCNATDRAPIEIPSTQAGVSITTFRANSAFPLLNVHLQFVTFPVAPPAPYPIAMAWRTVLPTKRFTATCSDAACMNPTCNSADGMYCRYRGGVSRSFQLPFHYIDAGGEWFPHTAGTIGNNINYACYCRDVGVNTSRGRVVPDAILWNAPTGPASTTTTPMPTTATTTTTVAAATTTTPAVSTTASAAATTTAVTTTATPPTPTMVGASATTAGAVTTASTASSTSAAQATSTPQLPLTPAEAATAASASDSPSTTAEIRNGSTTATATVTATATATATASTVATPTATASTVATPTATATATYPQPPITMILAPSTAAPMPVPTHAHGPPTHLVTLAFAADVDAVRGNTTAIVREVALLFGVCLTDAVTVESVAAGSTVVRLAVRGGDEAGAARVERAVGGGESPVLRALGVIAGSLRIERVVGGGAELQAAVAALILVTLAAACGGVVSAGVCFALRRSAEVRRVEAAAALAAKPAAPVPAADNMFSIADGQLLLRGLPMGAVVQATEAAKSRLGYSSSSSPWSPLCPPPPVSLAKNVASAGRYGPLSAATVTGHMDVYTHAVVMNVGHTIEERVAAVNSQWVEGVVNSPTARRGRIDGGGNEDGRRSSVKRAARLFTPRRSDTPLPAPLDTSHDGRESADPSYEDDEGPDGFPCLPACVMSPPSTVLVLPTPRPRHTCAEKGWHAGGMQDLHGANGDSLCSRSDSTGTVNSGTATSGSALVPAMRAAEGHHCFPAGPRPPAPLTPGPGPAPPGKDGLMVQRQSNHSNFSSNDISIRRNNHSSSGSTSPDSSSAPALGGLDASPTFEALADPVRRLSLAAVLQQRSDSQSTTTTTTSNTDPNNNSQRNSWSNSATEFQY